MVEPAISMIAVDKFYGAYHALRAVDLEIPAGQNLVVCGPSGSGKSTLLRCMNGLEQHDRGRIRVLGYEVGDDADALAAVRRRVGMVFQNFNLFPHLTVLENCVLPQIRAAGRTRAAATEIAERELDRLQVTEHAWKYPDQISGGQQQRVAIARALCHQPEILLFDEPTSALDPEMVAEVLNVIRDLARQEMTLVCVTHEMGFARAVADQALLMDDGRIVQRGPADQVLATLAQSNWQFPSASPDDACANA